MVSNRKRSRIPWYDKKPWRTIITIILTALSAICTGLITKFTGFWQTVGLICAAAVLIVFQMLVSIHYSTLDKVEEFSQKEMEDKIRAYKKIFEDLPMTLDTQAEGLNSIAKDIEQTGIVAGNRWTFDDASSNICKSVADFIEEYSGSPVNVYYVKTVDDAGTKVKMVGFYDYMRESPDIYMKERVVLSDDPAYYDLKLFARKKLHAEYRLSSKAVDKVFNYHDREKESGKYEQFLFIPVSCKKNKMIGMIEIVATKGNQFAQNKQDMIQIQRLLQIHLSILVLLFKAERAAIALPGKSV